MKPLLLKISGINSFIEEQTIHFGELTERGLFGIFGPTGSGKSTILDAMTLALYGEIPRSWKKNDLSGIINSQCDKGKVYYEFEIGNQKSRKRYFVSRTFKRDKQGSVKTNGVKLCDITDKEQPIVLEEKVTDVNRQIIEIIGLNCEDFTRSVVLPQGKFSDFLRLSGKDRRNMLERIFALQEYGSQLSQKLSNYKKGVEKDYTFVDGRLKSYEGVSKERYDTLLGEIENLIQQCTRAKEQYQQIEKEYESSKVLLELTSEYKENLKKQEDLKGQASQIEKYKIQYELAERVKNIHPYIEQQQSLFEQITIKETAKEKNQKDLGEISSILEKIRENWRVQQERKEKDIPRLLKEKDRVEFALERRKKLQGLSKKSKEMEQQQVKIQGQWEQIQGTLKESKEQITKLTKKIKLGQKSVQEMEVSAQYRRKLYEAYEAEREYQKALGEEKNLSKKIADLKAKELEPMGQEQKELESQIQKIETQLKKYNEEYKKIHNQIQQSYRQNMAALLARDLREGDCCPVCGSKEHPLKAKDIQGQEIEKLEKNQEALEENIEEIQISLGEKKNFLQKIRAEISIKEEILNENQGQQQQLQKNLNTLRTDLESLKEELGVEEIQKSLRQLQKREADLEKLQGDIQIHQRNKEEQEIQRNILQEKYNNCLHQLVQWNQRKEQLEKQIQELKNEIEQYCGQKDPEKEMKILQQEIDFIEKEYQKGKKDFEKYSNQKIDLEKEQKGLEDTLQQLYDHRDTIEKSLNHMLRENGFDTIEEVTACFKHQEERQELKAMIKKYEGQVLLVKENIKNLERRLNGHFIEKSKWQEIQQKKEDSKKNLESLQRSWIEKTAVKRDMEEKLKKQEIILQEKKEIEHKKALLEDLTTLLKGNEFVEFISMGQLRYIAREASQQLKKITRGRYAIELDADGNFIVRDDFNGGVRRNTQTLSGGETFLTSLSLALALSSHIQLKGNAHLEFFFLDEGFGTLDQELLEVVMDSLEKLHSDQLSVGLISHVEELKQRIPRKLIVQPAIAGVRGTKVILERG